ncbi:hypothetical protein BS47DRAFT_1345898 [Hydnum rufescens UP504]|uniref:Large ribosomal subunit protein mL44 n=1 Tax=Hydnum rufescens UP504 TaxID=1448309 RepID=A0A9P6AVE0_9AGAM|nr:hypothetical protein BS47DRAFT_1345898 [Hydnum rufescens UP504]
MRRFHPNSFPLRSLPSTKRISALPNAPFPPTQLIERMTPAQTPQLPQFSPEEWGSIQDPSPSALHALAARISFLSTHSPAAKAELLTHALTHPSSLSVYVKYYPRAPLPTSNKALAAVGNSLLGLFAAEWVHASYPHLPTRAIKAAVSAYVGPRTLADVAKEWGALPLLDGLVVQCIGLLPRSVIALLARHSSLADARNFTHTHFLSRIVDLEHLLNFRAPKVVLVETAAKFGMERPISRLIAETGRYSNVPIFIVGIYSGSEKLGEGFGNSLRMAEYRAAEDSLNRLYLTRQPSHLVRLPTSAFPSSFSYPHGLGSFSSLTRPPAPGEEYVAQELGEAEVLFASSDRSGKQAPAADPSASLGASVVGVGDGIQHAS